MIKRLTNNTGIPLSMAVWLANDDYDHIDEPNYISATNLIRSPRQIVLSSRATPQNTDTLDIVNLMSSKLGTAIHHSIETTWTNFYREGLQKLGYPEKVIERIRINPVSDQAEHPNNAIIKDARLLLEKQGYSQEAIDNILPPIIPVYAAQDNIIPVYMELRSFREIEGMNIGGKFDFVADGKLEDFKTTGVYTYMSGSNDWKYRLQGSIYRWLNPEIITNDHMSIQFLFTDWSGRDATIKKDKGYPPTKIFQHKIQLMSVSETELWVRNKIRLIKSLQNTPEDKLPLCEAHDLWQDAPTYKYYKNPAKKTRSTANFNTPAEAMIRLIEDGNVGVIEEVPGATKACLYCDAFQQCTQKDSLIACGSLRV